MLTQLIGPVALGDRVVVNTTAVELGLGTGGWHVVHWNLAAGSGREAGPGHVMKSRYTRCRPTSARSEEHWAELADVTSIDGMPVVAAALHSQLPAVAVAFKRRPARRAARVRDDRRRGVAARALRPRVRAAAASVARRDDHVRACVRRRLRSGVGLQRARGRALRSRTPTRRSWRWGRASSAPRPGSASAASRSGRCSTPSAGLGGTPIVALRVSFADPRERHRGVSHHSLTTLTIATRSRVTIALPCVGGDEEAQLRADLADARTRRAPRHRRRRAGRRRSALLESHGLHVVSMGRPAADDPGAVRVRGRRGHRRRANCCRKLAAMPDAPSRVERVLNLLALLLDTRVPLTRDEIVREVAGLSRADQRVPARVRARQGDAARHGRADHDRGDRRRLRGRLPRPARRLLPARPRPRRPRRPRRCASR